MGAAAAAAALHIENWDQRRHNQAVKPQYQLQKVYSPKFDYIVRPVYQAVMETIHSIVLLKHLHIVQVPSDSFWY